MENNVVDPVQWFATLGVGGILAGMMFYFYRKDVKQYTDLWKAQSELLTQVVKENTASNVKLISAVDRLLTDGRPKHAFREDR